MINSEIIPVYCFRANYRVERELYFRVFQGTALRGLFGAAFMAVAEKYLYSFFAPKAPPTFVDAGKFQTLPPPFVISPADNCAKHYPKDSVFSFNISLFGSGIRFLPEVLSALKYIENLTIGQKGKVAFVGAENIVSAQEINTGFNPDNAKSYKPNLNLPENISDSFAIRFITPVALKNVNIKQGLDFADFYQRLTERISLLAHLYNGSVYVRNQKPLPHTSLVTSINHDFTTVKIFHHSSRSHKKNKYNAASGCVWYKGDLRPFYAALKMGELLHIGSGTSSGLGRYAICLHS